MVCYSFLMSVYYKEKPDFLKIAIESMLNQSITPNEIIIVKDGNLGIELNEIIDNYVKSNASLFTILENKENIGLGPSLRKGVEISRNELIARMDSDDYSEPDRIEKQLKIFEDDDSLGIVGCFEAEFLDDIDNIVSIHRVPETNDEIFKFMKRRCAILHPTVIFKKTDVINSGNYQKTSFYDVYEDYDLFSRMVFNCKIRSYNIQEPLYRIRTSYDFFERRGGKKYAKTVLRFKWHLFKEHNISFIDFVISGFGQAFICILPNRIRKWFYLKFLRK